MKRYVDIDAVLNLFGIEDEDLYAIGTIKDALYDGTIKPIDIIKCKECREYRRWVGTDITFCDCTEAGVIDSDFCSKGKLREQEDKT